MIPLAEPNLTGKEREYVADALASNWVSGGGPYVERFEEMVAKASGKQWAIATTTGSAALHTAMTALGFTGRIKMPCYTFVAAKNVIESMGNTPVFYDSSKVSHDDAVIYPEGLPSLSLVDSAPAIGATLSPWGSLWTFSFNGNKTVTTGQGGAIVGDDFNFGVQLRDMIRQKRIFGGKFNYRMANVNAAMGCAQMERLDEFLEKKRDIWQRYADAGLPMLEAGESRWMCLMRSDDPEVDIRDLESDGVESRFLWNYLDGEKRNEWICLPCSTTLTEDQQDKVIKACEFLQ